MLFVSFLLQTQDNLGGVGGGFGMLLPLILIIGIMYFLMIRPQNKKQKELQKMLDALQKGDKVVTIGGIRGTIASVKKDAGTVVIKVDDNVKIEFNRSAVANLISEKSPKKVEVSETNKSEKKGLFGKKKTKEQLPEQQPDAQQDEGNQQEPSESEQKEAKDE